MWAIASSDVNDVQFSVLWNKGHFQTRKVNYVILSALAGGGLLQWIVNRMAEGKIPSLVVRLVSPNNFVFIASKSKGN